MIIEEKIRTVYDSMDSLGYPMPAFSEWRKSLVYFHPTVNGGLACLKDTEDPRVCWIQVHCPGALPGRETIKVLMILCGVCGCQYLATETRNPLVDRLCGMIGFQNIREGLWSIKLTGNGKG